MLMQTVLPLLQSLLHGTQSKGSPLQLLEGAESSVKEHVAETE